jgi:hypothetical protein
VREQFELGDLMVHTSPMQVRLLLRRAGVAAYRDPELRVGPGEALFVWLASALALRAPVDPPQQTALLELLAEQILEAGRRAPALLQAAGTTPLPATILTILDGTLVGLSGLDCFIDLRTGANVRRPPQAPVEAVSYDLLALFSLHVRRLDQEEERCARRAACPPRSKHPPPSSPGSGPTPPPSG